MWWAALWAAALASGAPPAPPAPSPAVCPPACICLSQSQVLCNSGSLRGVPAALPPGVTQLSLARADLRVLRSDAFVGLRSLRRVSLDACNLTLVRPFAFRGLPRLREVLIQNTPLATVHAFAFAGLQNLTSIVLSHNRITRVEGYAFAGTTFLRTLALDHNPIRTIASRAFSGLADVDRIVLPSGIRVVEPDAFSGLEGVGTLELAYMDLGGLRANTFRGLVRVRILSLRDSDLGIIRSGAFDGIQRIDLLDIVNNKIDGVEELYVPYNSSVRTFRLVGNHILETPSPGTVLLEVDTLVAQGNHFPCECGTRGVLDGPLATSNEFADENYCISPLKLRGKTLGAAVNAVCRESGGSARARAAAGAGGVSAQAAGVLAALAFVAAHL